MEAAKRGIHKENLLIAKAPGTTCLVCHVEAGGIHFGAVSCAACGAFFRRSIVARKKYACQLGNCKTVYGLANQRLCRFCRLQKCFEVGMRPEKVQCPRERHAPGDFVPPKTDCKRRKQAQSTAAMNVFARMMLQYQLLKQRRSLQYHWGRIASAGPPVEAILSNSRLVWEAEPIFLSEYLGACEAFVNLEAADKTILFTNYNVVSRVIEQAYTTMIMGGVGENRGYLLDGTFVPASEDSIARYYANGSETAHCTETMRVLARTALPILEFNIHVLGSAMEKLSLSEAELVALLYIILWDDHVDDLSPIAKEIAKRQRGRLFEDLADHFAAMNYDPAVQIGNIILLLSAVQENAFMWREYFRLLDLTKTKVLSNQLMQLLNFDMS